MQLRKKIVYYKFITKKQWRIVVTVRNAYTIIASFLIFPRAAATKFKMSADVL